MRGPDYFRFGARETTREEQAWDEHPFHRKANGPWRGARGFRAAPCRDAPRRDGEEAHLGLGGGELRAPLVGSNWLYELSAVRRAHRANWIPRAGPGSKVRVALSAPLERFVEAGELRSREKDQATTRAKECGDSYKQVSYMYPDGR